MLRALVSLSQRLGAAAHRPPSAASQEPDLRPPREVFLGHWKNLSGKVHYYIDKRKLTIIENDQKIGTFGYQILEEDPAAILMHISLENDDSPERVIRFDYRRKGFMESFQVETVTLNHMLVYVDDARSP